MTEWYYEDEVCWIAECESCSVPMVVWREHDNAPSADVKTYLHEKLAAVVAEHFEFVHYVDDNLRSIPLLELASWASSHISHLTTIALSPTRREP